MLTGRNLPQGFPRVSVLPVACVLCHLWHIKGGKCSRSSKAAFQMMAWHSMLVEIRQAFTCFHKRAPLITSFLGRTLTHLHMILAALLKGLYKLKLRRQSTSKFLKTNLVINHRQKRRILTALNNVHKTSVSFPSHTDLQC